MVMSFDKFVLIPWANTVPVLSPMVYLFVCVMNCGMNFKERSQTSAQVRSSKMLHWVHCQWKEDRDEELNS